MSRLIDADELEKELEKMTQDFLDDKTIQGSFCAGVTVEMLEEVRKAPTVDAVPVAHGRWIESPDNDGMDYECSNLKCKCRISYNGSRVSGDFNYCPNCGAKMDEVSE